MHESQKNNRTKKPVSLHYEKIAPLITRRTTSFRICFEILQMRLIGTVIQNP